MTKTEVDLLWKKQTASISRIISYYKEALIKLGIPDCAWLEKTLSLHKAAMTQQAGYELDVASGHAIDSLNHPNSYQAPENLKELFFDILNSYYSYCLKGTNPNYEIGPEWRNNCQRCVPTYEARRRGESVTAKPFSKDAMHLAYHPFDVWINPSVYVAAGSGEDEIKQKMFSWGNGARAQVVVFWDGPHGGGHTFIAEQKDGETLFYDPQTGKNDAKKYFSRVKNGTTQYCRIDVLELSGYKSDCYKEEGNA